jgi:predicted dehydrogenase
VTIIGGGMITRIQLLPTMYYLQQLGVVGDIQVCALNGAALEGLRSDSLLARGFPGQDFTPHPDPALVNPQEDFPHLYKEVLARAPKGSIVVIAVPDQLHYSVLEEALENDLHICIVKPLVLKHSEAQRVAEEAFRRGLVVGVEYHKRFDSRNLMARQAYSRGQLGNFRLGQAQMIEPYYYRDSNFQNWCTCENSDMFTYVGCHYVDLVAFITGLRPVSVNVYGIKDRYPNGNEGYLWTDARVTWENGASLSVVNALGYPNAAAGGNAQGLTLWCQGEEDATLLVHSDQYRGVKCSYDSPGSQPGETIYGEPNPDYFQLLDLGGKGAAPSGYGHRSVEFIVRACRLASEMSGLEKRQEYLLQLDSDGIMATPANSSYNELVSEAARKSILADGREVVIEYEGSPRVSFREYP